MFSFKVPIFSLFFNFFKELLHPLLLFFLLHFDQELSVFFILVWSFVSETWGVFDSFFDSFVGFHSISFFFQALCFKPYCSDFIPVCSSLLLGSKLCDCFLLFLFSIDQSFVFQLKPCWICILALWFLVLIFFSCWLQILNLSLVKYICAYFGNLLYILILSIT